MSEDDYHRQSAVDLLTLILVAPFCMWLGWWGILPAFGIGFALNVLCAGPIKSTKDTQ